MKKQLIKALSKLSNQLSATNPKLNFWLKEINFGAKSRLWYFHLREKPQAGKSIELFDPQPYTVSLQDNQTFVLDQIKNIDLHDADKCLELSYATIKSDYPNINPVFHTAFNASTNHENVWIIYFYYFDTNNIQCIVTSTININTQKVEISFED